MIGPLRVHFAGRYCDLSGLVLRDEPLLGAVPMEMMGLVRHLSSQTLTVNPASPYVPVALAKYAAASGCQPTKRMPQCFAASRSKVVV